MLKRDHDEMKFKPFLNIINVTVDYCGYMNKKGVGGFLIDIIAKDLISHGNFLQACPLHGHIYLKNFKIDVSTIPFIIPTGEYLGHLYVYLKGKKADMFGCDCSGYAEVKSK